MPFIKIWIHTVWATKDRQPYLLKEIRQQVFQHILENSRAKGIHVDHINGHTDHIHCLVSMDADQNIATIMNLLKGESSFWINRNILTKTKFGWQDEYFAVSVSHSQIEKSENIFKTNVSIIRKKHFNRNMTNLLRNMVLILL